MRLYGVGQTINANERARAIIIAAPKMADPIDRRTAFVTLKGSPSVIADDFRNAVWSAPLCWES